MNIPQRRRRESLFGGGVFPVEAEAFSEVQ